MESIEKNKRTYWIDIAKFMAIIAVMIDHTNGLLYQNVRVSYFSYYSVSLFILVMGVTSYWSYSRYNGSIAKKVSKACLKILKPYLIATFIYGLILDRQFHFENFLNRAIHFNASSPFYYVMLYIQLLVIAPFIYFSFNCAKGKRGILIEIAGLAFVLMISFYTTNYSNILDIYGGGGKLFGGTYLILFYLGMIFGKYSSKIPTNKIVVAFLLVISIVLTLMWWNFISTDNCRIDLNLPYGSGYNPPSISFGLYAILMALSIFFLEQVISNNDRLLKIFGSISVLGKHTLYMFLYHRLFLDYVLPMFFIQTGIQISNIWILRIIYFICMICGSLIIEIVLEKLNILFGKIMTS
ncbi:acyltransferase family protein [Butyrivibrio sp. AE3004]|uniref:acyltransferase family protein n=1 Tax=Butyrivibrio sp. AE3004 TaxID=1506994 RepID=UPI000494403C|nr:acyltransferase [Butyrivibrio sp. AE3004]